MSILFGAIGMGAQLLKELAGKKTKTITDETSVINNDNPQQGYIEGMDAANIERVTTRQQVTELNTFGKTMNILSGGAAVGGMAYGLMGDEAKKKVNDSILGIFQNINNVQTTSD